MKRFGKHINPATILALVALVFAITGGAFAATDGSGSGAKATASSSHATVAKKKSKKKKSSSGKPGPRGPAGAAGAQGPAGAAGPQGPAGASGAKGENGAGTNGTNGADGKSVVLVNEEPEHCENEAGVTYEVEGSGKRNEVCSSSGGGASVGLPTTLGPEETETGTWASETFGLEGFVAISFPVPLEAELEGSHVVMVQHPGVSVPAECENGAAPASADHPEAQPGYLCVFRGFFETEEETHLGGTRTPSNTGAGASTVGAVLGLVSEVASENRGSGTWAVTAP